MLARSCLLRRLQPSCLPHPTPSPLLHRAFHQTPFRRASHIPNHYETLDLPTQATPAEVKKQFYRLSKANHPDLHPNDPSKSKRFVAISEAYSVLGSPEKRQRYDRDFLPASAPASSPGTGHRGSYSSHSTPAGGRPASGLSKRRTQFKGPPPSFYRSGGWGAHSEKRAQYASHGPEGTTDHHSGPSSSSAPGTGPGGFTHGFDGDVPHFDQQGHHTRHENLERSRHHGRTRVRRSADEMDYGGGGGDPLVKFVVVCGIVAIGYGSGVFSSGKPKGGGKKKGENDG